jgi:hypothetical protein
MTTLRQFERAVAQTTIPGREKLWADTFYERITGGQPRNVALAQEGSNELLVEIQTRRFLTEFLIGPDFSHPTGLTRSFNTLDNEIFNASPNAAGLELIRDVNRGFIHLGFGGEAFSNPPGVEANIYAPGITTEIFVEQRA